MENLDGKYFENVISSLKKEKERENFVVRENFHSELRDSLNNHIISMVEPSVHTADWVNWVLRNKILFGSVPTMAVVALVAYNALGWGNIAVPSNQFVPETQVSVISSINEEKDTKDLEIAESSPVLEEDYLDGDKKINGIKTFSAELVMPPDEILSRRFLISDKIIEEDGQQEVSAEVTTSYKFMENVSLETAKVSIPQIDVNSYYPWTDAASSPSVPIRVFSGLIPVVRKPVTANNYYDLTTEEEESASTEAIGREEKSGQVTGELEGQIVETTVTESKLIPTGANTTNDGLSGTQINTTALPVIENAQPASLPSTPITPSTEISVTRGYKIEDMMSSQSLFINPVEEFAKVPDMVDITAAQLTEANDRFVYEGANRVALVKAVEDELALFETSLSADYYVVIEPILEGSYKATLFQNRKVSRIWIITEQRGVFRIVTEIVP